MATQMRRHHIDQCRELRAERFFQSQRIFCQVVRNIISNSVPVTILDFKYTVPQDRTEIVPVTLPKCIHRNIIVGYLSLVKSRIAVVAVARLFDEDTDVIPVEPRKTEFTLSAKSVPIHVWIILVEILANSDLIWFSLNYGRSIWIVFGPPAKRQNIIAIKVTDVIPPN